MDGIESQLELIAERYGLQDIYAFGSRAGEIAARVRGEGDRDAGSKSDADVAVQPRPGHALNAHERTRLTIGLEDLLGESRVDLVILSEARPFLALDVIRGELLYTADPRAQAEQELYILRRAADLAPFQRSRVREILTGGAR